MDQAGTAPPSTWSAGHGDAKLIGARAVDGDLATVLVTSTRRMLGVPPGRDGYSVTDP